MSRVYCPRHPERTVFYRVLFHYFESFLLEYENRFERHFGHLRPIIQEVTVGHHEAFKAVVISIFYAKSIRLLCHCVPRNKPGLRQSKVWICPDQMS